MTKLVLITFVACVTFVFASAFGQAKEAEQAQMKAMQGMGGGMMMGMMNESARGDGKGALKSGEKSSMPCGDMMKCHEMMEARVDMMQHDAAEQTVVSGK